MPVKSARSSAWAIGGILAAALTAGAFWTYSIRASSVPPIAFIPQTAGAMLWDVEHYGATRAAEKLKLRLYWNAPTSENDWAGQVSLIDRVVRGRYQGLVLAPNHPLAPLTPLRRVIAAGLPVVIVSAPLDLPAGNNVGYIVNDDEKMGELAAGEIARLLHGRGSVALVGVAAYAPGVIRRVRSAEHLFATQFPGIHVVIRAGGANNPSFAEGRTMDAIGSHPELKAILSFTANSTRGVLAALKNRTPPGAVILVGCEQDTDLIAHVVSGEVAAIVAENTYRMGYEAVGLISDSLAGKPMPGPLVVPPLLIARQNFASAQAFVLTGVER